MNARMSIAIAISAVAIGWALWLVSVDRSTGSGITPVSATIVDGTQIIDITARGGYSPRIVIAKAGVPTVLRVTTNGTFDCSASVIIPSLSYQKFFKPSETEDIAVSAEQATGTLRGLCSMGMYNFQIKFQ